jgi:acyl-CoA synthetase (AMP-forming)/AMP-acid ligase II
MTLIEQVRKAACQNPDGLFLAEAAGERSFGRGEFFRGAACLVERLRDAGLQRGDRVGLLLHNSPEFAACYFACLAGGFVAVPLNPAWTARDILYAAEAAEIDLLALEGATQALAPPELLQRVTRVLEIGSSVGAGAKSWSLAELSSAPPDFGDLRSDDLFVITFTSGTTSRPKGVCHAVGSMFGAAAAFNEVNEFGPHTRLYHVINMAYMAGILNTILCPFLAGGAIAVDSAFGAPVAVRFWQAPRRWNLNTLWLAPSMLAMLLKLDRDPAASEFCRERLLHACVGTAPLPQKLRHEFESRYGVRLLESYGLSETLFVAANTPRRATISGSVGRALPGVEIRVRSSDAAGPEGELEVRSPFQMSGYLDPETHHVVAAAPAEWFPTGDLGCVAKDGQVFITGRQKDLIIRGGVNVSPRGVEEALLLHDSIEEAAVIGVPHEFYGEEILAVVKLRTGFRLDQVRPGLLELCRQSVGKAASPSQFEAVSELPRTSTGKVKKSDLRERFANRSAALPT